MNDLKAYLDLKAKEAQLETEKENCYTSMERIRRSYHADIQKIRQQIDGLNDDLEAIGEQINQMEETVKEN